MPTDPSLEQELVRRAQAGDEHASAELFKAHAPAIFRYFFFRVQDRTAAEDLTSDVFLKMVEGLPRFVDRGVPFAAWLFRIAHDRAVDHHRRAVHRQSDPLSDQLPDQRADTEAAAIQLTENHHLYQLIAELTEEQQTVVQLRFIEGYSLEDTARILGKTTGAIKALQHRALRQLGRRLEP